MKRALWLAVVIVGVFSLSLASAEEKNPPMMEKKDMRMEGDQSGKIRDKMMRRHLMMSAMMPKSMVTTSDGGIVVLAGNKLTKYDKDLNVIKEVEIKMDMEKMQEMMGKGMRGEGMKGPRPEPDEDDWDDLSEESKHDSHH